MTTQTTHNLTSSVTTAPVSKDSLTIAGEPELYLSTPEPEVSSSVFTFPARSVSQWMTHGLSIFYREAGPKDAPTILFLHGLPSSSRMFQPLLTRLGDKYRLIAPDHPGYGHSDWPSPKEFANTFDHIAFVMTDSPKRWVYPATPSTCRTMEGRSAFAWHLRIRNG